MTGCNHDDLLGLARGELPPDRAAEVESHADGCASCAQELSWLRTERALFRTQTETPAPHVWQGIERRIVIAREERRARRQRWLQVGSAVTLVAAAAGFLIAIWSNGLRQQPASQSLPASSSERAETPAPEVDHTAASQALDAAEHQYRTAIRDLEVAYHDERDRLDPEEVLRFDEQLRSLRKQLKAERAAAQDDVWARRRVLRTYSAYMRTMQAMVLPRPEASR